MVFHFWKSFSNHYHFFQIAYLQFSSGAVAQDGRIEPGDMILQVNEVSFENMSNDDAVKVLREAVMKPG